MKRRYYIPEEAQLKEQELYAGLDRMNPLRKWLRSTMRMSELPQDYISKSDGNSLRIWENFISNIDGNGLSIWPWAVEPFTRAVYRERGAKACIDTFCNSVVSGDPVDADAMEGVADLLDMIRTEVDELPPEAKNRSARIGKIAATHLGLLGEKGRPSDARSISKGVMAAIYFNSCQHSKNLSYDAASEKTAEKFNVSESRVRQYNQEYGHLAVVYWKQAMLAVKLGMEYDALFILTRKIKKGDLVAKLEESTLSLGTLNGFDVSITVRPPTTEQILTIRRWQNPRDRITLLNWWVSNTIYEHPEAKIPISKINQVSHWSIRAKGLFMSHIRKVLYPD